MKLKLAKVQSQGTGSWADVTEHGSLRSQMTKGDTINFSNKNLEKAVKENGKYNRVVLLITEKGKDEPLLLSLSERLSGWVRKLLKAGKSKLIVIKSLLEMQVIENEDGVFFLTHKGTLEKGLTLEELSDDTVEVVPFESLL